MKKPEKLESSFNEYISDLSKWVPDGFIDVNIHLLQTLGLLSAKPGVFKHTKPPMEHFFHIFETKEKITLVNDTFVVWIVPEIVESEAKTFVLIALNSLPKPTLEMVFVTSGIYNSSRFVLQVLEAFLEEIKDNEEWLTQINN
jgi:hypothetical protein